MNPDDIAAGFDPLVEATTSIARALRDLGNAGATTPMGALEAHGLKLHEGMRSIAESLDGVAVAIQHAGEDVRDGLAALAAAVSTR